MKTVIVGSGNIASSLALLFACHGRPVTVLGRSEASLARCAGNIQTLAGAIAERGLLTPPEEEHILSQIEYATDPCVLCTAEVVFESVAENREVKRAVLEQAEKLCGSVLTFASTSSAYSAEELSKDLPRMRKVMHVAHPFYPPHLIPYFEVMRTEDTEESATELLYDLLESMGRKVVVMKKGAPGFIANRLQHALLREAVYMVEQGYASPRDIDKALMYSFMPRYTRVGLFEHQDAAGLDMVESIQNYLLPYLCDGSAAGELIAQRVKEGKLGQKSGEGIYTWTAEEIEDFRNRASEPYWQFFV